MERNRTRWLGWVALVSLASASHAQTLLKSIPAPTTNGDYGYDLAAGFDVDQDGVPDVAMGDGTATTAAGWLAGQAAIQSGATGAVLFQFFGAAALERFGSAIAFAGDVDADGRPDLLVASDGPVPGIVRVFSGRDGSALYTLTGGVSGTENVERLGSALSRIGDINGDGHADFAVGALASESAGAFGNQGLVRVYSGLDGSVLHSFWGDVASDNLGGAVTWLGDVDGDGVDDLAGTAVCIDWGGHKAPYVRLWSGATGAVLRTLIAPHMNGGFGACITGLGDIDGDGHGDLAIGEPFESSSFQPGYAYVYSGGSGALLHMFTGPSLSSAFGFALSDAGDVDLDGTPDLIVGARLGAVGGTAWVHSGADWSELLEIPGLVVIGQLGAVDAAGDFDHDGYADVATVRYGDATFHTTNGVARIYSARLTPPTAYCTAKLNSQGCYALVSSSGSPSVSNSSPFTIRADGVLNQKFGLMFYGTDRQALVNPFGTLCVAAWKIRRTPLQNSGGNPPPNDCSGVLTFDFNAWIRSGVDASLVPSQTVCAQFWYRDVVSPGGSSTSDALQFTVGP
ncbi:MAG: VCBS repeat-containing protein [Planctomycetes bacterium]|nr:VCBS repeat-containing protein [Planctomycetota bacterium]